MLTNEKAKRKILGLCPYTRETAEIYITVENKRAKYIVELASLYNMKTELTEALKCILEMHRCEINSMMED